MQRIYYASGSILTGERIAAAVLEYAEALAKSPLADTITIPFVDESTGDLGSATLLIGPSSQLMFVPENSGGFDEPQDDELVDELDRRGKYIGSPHPVPQAVPEPMYISDEYE